MSPKEQADCEKFGGHRFVTGLIHTWCFWCGFVLKPEKKGKKK